MKYREQCEDYWPTPEELRECMQKRSYKPPSKSWGKKIEETFEFCFFAALGLACLVGGFIALGFMLAELPPIMAMICLLPMAIAMPSKS